MANNDLTRPVTRRELYGALVVVWLYIMLVLCDLLRIEWRWSTFILLWASLFMMTTYSVVAFRTKQAGGGVSPKGSPPSDRVKELARDPAKKIEAIVAYCEETGAGLAEAKEAVEGYINSL